MNDERVAINNGCESEKVILNITKKHKPDGNTGRFFTLSGMTGIKKVPQSVELCHSVILSLCN